MTPLGFDCNMFLIYTIIYVYAPDLNVVYWSGNKPRHSQSTILNPKLHAK